MVIQVTVGENTRTFVARFSLFPTRKTGKLLDIFYILMEEIGISAPFQWKCGVSIYKHFMGIGTSYVVFSSPYLSLLSALTSCLHLVVSRLGKKCWSY